MKKFIITGAAFVALAVPAVASASPGYSVSETASCNGAAHGTHGYLGAKGERPNLGQGDTMGNDKLGASPLTGPSNKAASQACKTVLIDGSDRGDAGRCRESTDWDTNLQRDTPMKKMIGVVVLGIALMAPLGVDVADAEASTHSTVLCAKDGIHDLLVRKPRNCAFNARTQTNAYMTHVQNMRWRNWGGPASCGRGTLRANSGYRAPLRFCLYQPRVWEERIYRYTRLRGVVGKGCAWTDHYECGIKPYRRHIRVVV